MGYRCFSVFSNVLLISKGASVEDLSNYCPILLSAPEDLRKTDQKSYGIMLFLEGNQCFNKNKYGFLNKKVTTDAMFEILEQVFDMLNNGHAVAAVFCDLSKPFNCENGGYGLHSLLSSCGVPLASCRKPFISQKLLTLTSLFF